MMNPFWSRIVYDLSPYVSGEQPRIAILVKLNLAVHRLGTPSPIMGFPAAVPRSDSP
jgi:hypothetical protein